LALVSAIRKSDRAAVAIVCALESLDNGNIQPVPFAVLVESSDEFEDPFL
jgi:hypothetical protein